MCALTNSRSARGELCSPSAGRLLVEPIVRRLLPAGNRFDEVNAHIPRTPAGVRGTLHLTGRRKTRAARLPVVRVEVACWAIL